MHLQIRDPRAHDLATRVARARKTTKTAAVIRALEADLALAEAERNETAIESVRRIAAELRQKGKPGGRDMTKDEIDEMWGHEPDQAE